MFRHICTTLALALTTSTLHAQELRGEVTQDPNAGTVTYSFDFNGPPCGFSRLYVGTWMADPPLDLGDLGYLYIDPSFIFPVTPFQQLDDFGHLYTEFTVPENLTAGLPLTFQTLNVDEVGVVRFSDNAVALAQRMAAGACHLDYAMSYDTKGTKLSIAGSGPPGSEVEVKVVGTDGVRHTMKTTIGGDGKYSMHTNVPGGLTRDDDILILCDRGLVDKIDLFKWK